MALENVRELLKAVKTDPEVKKALQDLEKPTDEEGIIQYYVEAAKRLGYAVTEEDIRKAIADLTQKQEAKTEEAVGKLKAVSDDELDQVAGGKAYSCDNNESIPCVDTYKQRENCWRNDGCDQSHIIYSDYECQHNYYGHACGNKEATDCSSFIF